MDCRRSTGTKSRERNHKLNTATRVSGVGMVHVCWVNKSHGQEIDRKNTQKNILETDTKELAELRF